VRSASVRPAIWRTATAFALLFGGPALAPPGTGVAGTFGVVGQVHGARVPPSMDLQLVQTARAFAQAWAMGDVDEVAAHLAPGGILLRLEGPARAALPARQAFAALREYLRPYEEGTVEVSRAAPVSGNPDRGFAELRWTARVSGTSQRVERSVYVGLGRHGDRWRVTEVRLIP
jgi:ketosteroid isomerase-like protein